MGKIERIEVPDADRVRLERLVQDRNTAQKVVWRSRIVLLTSLGMGVVEISATVGKSVPFIWTKSAGEILDQVARARQALHNIRIAENDERIAGHRRACQPQNAARVRRTGHRGETWA